MKIKRLTDDFTWVGTLDPELRLFDIVVVTEYGSSYNSYILRAENANILFEASKKKFFNEYKEKIETICPIKDIDYLVVSHTEPDHTGTIEKMLDINPDMKILSSMAANNFLKEMIDRDFDSRIVKDGEEINLGNKTMQFIMAPNLHWPDTMFTFIKEENILVTCDAFGGHYCAEEITNDNLKSEQDYLSSVKFYFDNIIFPFKKDLLNALEKIKDLDIKIIANGHGPVIVKEPQKIIDLYKGFASTKNPNKKKTVVIPYVSAYGYTKMIADKIRDGIIASGDIEVRMHDMVGAELDIVMNDIYYADGFLLGTPTIVGDALLPIWNIASKLNAKVYGGKIASAFGSFGWSGEAVPNLMSRLSQLKMKLYKDGLRIRFKPDEKQKKVAFEFGRGFGEAILKGEI